MQYQFKIISEQTFFFNIKALFQSWFDDGVNSQETDERVSPLALLRTAQHAKVLFPWRGGCSSQSLIGAETPLPLSKSEWQRTLERVGPKSELCPSRRLVTKAEGIRPHLRRDRRRGDAALRQGPPLLWIGMPPFSTRPSHSSSGSPRGDRRQKWPECPCLRA